MADRYPLTERDFRMPEYQRPDFKIEDYERRDDGKIVRKDRWEKGIRSIATTMGFYKDLEVDDVVLKAEAAKGDADLYAYLREHHSDMIVAALGGNVVTETLDDIIRRKIDEIAPF